MASLSVCANEEPEGMNRKGGSSFAHAIRRQVDDQPTSLFMLGSMHETVHAVLHWTVRGSIHICVANKDIKGLFVPISQLQVIAFRLDEMMCAFRNS